LVLICKQRYRTSLVSIVYLLFLASYVFKTWTRCTTLALNKQEVTKNTSGVLSGNHISA
jgi:hypothetical protein